MLLCELNESFIMGNGRHHFLRIPFGYGYRGETLIPKIDEYFAVLAAYYLYIVYVNDIGAVTSD